MTEKDGSGTQIESVSAAEVSWLPVDDPASVLDDSDGADEVETEVEEESAVEPETDEVEGDEDEAEAEPDADDGSEGDEEDDAGESEQAKGHNPDKGLQKVQQRVATIEKQQQERFEKLSGDVGKLTETLTKLSETIASRPSQEATPTEQKKIDQASDDLDDLVKQIEKMQDSDDIVSGSEIGSLLKRVVKAQAKADKSAGSKESSELAKKVDDLQTLLEKEREAREHQQRQIEIDRHWSKFKDDEGFDGRPIWDKALSEVRDTYPNHDENIVLGIASDRFNSRVADEKAKLAKAATKEKPVKKKPTPTSTKGTQTVSTSASSTRASTPGKGGGRPPLYVPD